MSVSDFPGTGNAGGEPQPLASPERDLAIWWCPLARDAAAMPALWATLSPEEVARAGRFGTEALRQRYVVGYTSTNARRDGAWRSVVIAATPDGVTIRSAGGYHAPVRAVPPR